MNNDLQRQTEKIQIKSKKKKIWKRVVSILSCVVVFCTTYALILPAITMEHNVVYCGEEEHTHSEDCYKIQLVCDKTKEGHEHSESCYEETRTLICGQTEEPGHKHNDSCYKKAQVLTCTNEDPSHEHTDACYTEQEVLVCTQDESEGGGHVHTDACYKTERKLICGLPEEGHEHTESCYKKELVCGKEEHAHSLMCYANPKADLETKETWENSIADVELTGVWSDDILSIAKSQMGYQESEKNYIVDDDGVTKQGYTRYGAWYGVPYGEWCAMFTSFCFEYADVPKDVIPQEASCAKWIEKLEALELYQDREEYIPNPGDIIFFNYKNERRSDHVGIVESVNTEENEIVTIEGNNGKKVGSHRYAADDGHIIGYCDVTTAYRTYLEQQEKTLKEQLILTEQQLTAEMYTDASYTEGMESDVKIQVSGLLPEGAVVRAYPVQMEDTDFEDISVNSESVLCVYDITVFMTDAEGGFVPFEPEEDALLTVTFVLNEGMVSETADGNSIHVFHISDEGEMETIIPQVDGGTVSFEAEHFSTYGVYASRGVGIWEDLVNALSGANSGDVITLTGDFTAGDAAYTYNKDGVTLDFAGHTITAKENTSIFNVTGGSLIMRDSSGNHEEVANADGNLYGNAATYDNQTLTYYVTESAVTNASTGATSETLKKHTVTLGEGNGGGLIGNGTGRAIEQSGGTVTFESGYICNFNREGENEDTFGGAIKITDNGTFNMTGGVLAANSAPNGGAVYLTGGTMDMTGGVISGNTSNRTKAEYEGAIHNGGGGIFADGENVKVNLSDGYITNNIQIGDAYFDGGGGVSLSGGSTFNMTGGFVTGNIANGGGGIKTNFQRYSGKVNISGGHVSANYARTTEGGGVTIDRDGEGTITGGYITNNHTNTTEHWGGGGLFCADGATLNLRSVLVTNNTATGLGGGVAGCSTGKIYLYINEGFAVFDNHDADPPDFAHGGEKNGKDKEAYEYGADPISNNPHADYFCALESTVTGTMLGGGSANWQGSADGTAVTVGKDQAQTAEHAMGLKSNPSEEDKNAAKAAAKVYINGNSSGTHGGGILANGNLIVGVPKDITIPTQLTLSGLKILEKGDIKEHNFTFSLTDENGNVKTTGSASEDGTLSFKEPLVFNETGIFVYYIREEIPEQIDDIEYDAKVYRMTVNVSKREEDLIEESRKILFPVEVKMEVSTDGEKTWKELYTLSDLTEQQMIRITQDGTATFINKQLEDRDITVIKRWAGDDPHPDSVTVELLRNGSVIDQIVLNAQNSWTYIWEKLPIKDENGADYNYTVIEQRVPGYEADYTIEASSDGESGTYWIPAERVVAGGQYILVSPDGTQALKMISNNWVTDQARQLIGAVDENGRYEDSVVDKGSIFTAEAVSGGFKFKNSGESSSYLRLEKNGTNYLKGGSNLGYGSVFIYDGTYLTGKSTGNETCTVNYVDNKFNASPSSTDNYARLYYRVNIIADNTPVIVITNTKSKEILYTLNITKVGKTNKNPLAGAEFKLTKGDETLHFIGENGSYTYAEAGTENLTDTLITDENGKLIVSGLHQGTYTLTETKAPEGYDPIESQTITVGEENQPTTVEFTLEDPEHMYELPETGGVGTTTFTIAGATLIVLSVLICGYMKGRRRERGTE